MINQSLWFIFAGCALGVLQLMVGLAIGMWLRRTEVDVRRSRQDMLQSSLIAQRLHDLAAQLSTSAQEHRNQLDEATRLLATEGGATNESLAELVVGVIGNIVQANKSLQSKLDTAENRLEEQAGELEAHISRSLTDALTGLPNRREFNDRLEERMSAWSRRRETFSLLMLDVDHFKKLNDQYGHVAGDQVLAAIGRAVRGAIRREDAVARYGGEEFAILLPSTSLEQATHAAEKVRAAVARAVVSHNDQRITATASGGVATIQTNERAEALLQRADAALYAAKAAGRNCTFVHDGAECLPTLKFQSPTAGPAARLVKLINSPDAGKPPVDDVSGERALEFGAYPRREAISAELAQTCQELRRIVEQRGERQPQESSVAQP